MESNLNPEFEFTTGYVTEEGGPNELVIGKLEYLIFLLVILSSKSFGTMTWERMRVWDTFSLTSGELRLFVLSPVQSSGLCTVERRSNSSGIHSMTQKEAVCRCA